MTRRVTIFEGRDRNKQYSLFGAKVSSDICPWTLSVTRSEQFSALEEKRELRGTDTPRKNISP